MKMLYVVAIPGTLNFFKKHIEMLVRSGVTVDIACNTELGQGVNVVPKEYDEYGCKIHTVHFSRSIFSNHLTAYREIKKILGENDYSAVHVHTPIASVITRLACTKFRKKGLKVIYTAHGFQFFNGAPKKDWLLYYPIESFLARKTDALITINHEDYTRAKRMKTNAYYIPGVGVSTERFHTCTIDKVQKRAELGIENEDPIVLTIGELHPRKNQIAAIQAAHQCRTKFNLLIAGEGPLYSELEDKIKELGLSDRVKLLGYRTDIDDLLALCDAFVLPSKREGLGLVGIEAMASSKPLVTSNINGILDYMEDGKTGMTCAPCDYAAFAENIERLLNDDALRTAMGKYNAEKAERFNHAASCRALKQIYTEIGVMQGE